MSKRDRERRRKARRAAERAEIDRGQHIGSHLEYRVDPVSGRVTRIGVADYVRPFHGLLPWRRREPVE